ncbi:MAG TPA: type II toxin-antitoxin system RelE/ParE family toxin [Bacteroidetes bacterium]|nr:type II toxin-antitoxin system RelE/ParE family toxin [Bacteroidota bacterium]
MVRRIIWARRAQEDRKSIFSYWNKRNKSKNYSKKLNSLFNQSIKLLSIYPQIGRTTNKENIRIKVVRDYLIIYEFTDRELIILSIFDTRQNQSKLKNIF